MKKKVIYMVLIFIVGISPILWAQETSNRKIEAGNQALALARESKDLQAEAKALRNIGLGHEETKNHKKALECLEQALQIFKQLNDNGEIAVTLNNMADIYYTLKQYDTALEHYLEALRIEEELDRKKEMALVLFNLGNIYKMLSNNLKAREYHLRSLEIRRKLGNKINVIDSLLDTGHVYLLERKFDNALECFREALKTSEEEKNKTYIARSLVSLGIAYHYLKDYTRALEYYKKSLQAAYEANYNKGMAYYTWYVAKVYEDLNNYPLALEYHQKALEVGERINERWVSASALISVGSLDIKFRDFDKAKEYIEKGLKIAKEIDSKDLIISSFEILSQLYEAKGSYKKALEYHKHFYQAEIKRVDERRTQHFNELQTSHEAAKRAKEIGQLKTNNQIQQLRLSQERIIRYGLIVGFILVLIILVLLFKKYIYLLAFWKKQKYIGHFRLLAKIGSGGMGTVYKANSIHDKSEIAAVKILKEELFADEVTIKRFKREAAIIDRLEHPNIIKIFERGESKKTLFIAMEYLEGKTLADKLNQEGQLNLGESLHIMLQISDALAFIHSKNIIHRDLKPDNIMLIKENGGPNFVKLLDFGLARREFESRLTQSGNLLGTLQYVAPEQVIKADSLPANDIFSLGVTFYRMLSGRNPFNGESALAIMREIIGKEPLKISQLRPDVPGELNDLVMNMMNKNPGQRPSAQEIQEALSILLAGS